jgi:uncharacterized protein YqgV (UPF0045/DUF77 family)
MEFITNASLQLIPIVQDRHPFEWVDEVIVMIEKSGLTYQVGAFGTVVEGTYKQVAKLIEGINAYLFKEHCAEWVLNVQWHIRSEASVTVEEKIKGR